VPWRFEELAGRADSALLDAKSRGRNCVSATPSTLAQRRASDVPPEPGSRPPEKGRPS